MEKVIENLEITWLLALLLDWRLLEAERTRVRVQINHRLIDDLGFHKLRGGLTSCWLLIIDGVLRDARICGTWGISTHCTKIRYDGLFVMWGPMQCFSLNLLRFIDLLLYFTHSLINQPLNMFRIILLWCDCGAPILRSLYSSCTIPRFRLTIRVVFRFLWLRVNYFQLFLFILVVAHDDILVDVTALSGEKSLTFLFLGKNFLIIFVYVIGIKYLFEVMGLIKNPRDEIGVQVLDSRWLQ